MKQKKQQRRKEMNKNNPYWKDRVGGSIWSEDKKEVRREAQTPT